MTSMHFIGELDVAPRNLIWKSAEPVRILKKEGMGCFRAVDSNCKCST